MPVFSDGQKISETEWARLIQSVPASYVVWKGGSTYRAECLLKGGTDYSRTDAATVLRSAIDALTDGGKIFVKKAIYPISGLITVKQSNLEFEAEIGTIFQLDANSGLDIVHTDSLSHIWFKGITFDGQAGTADFAIRTTNMTSGKRVWDLRIEKCRFTGFTKANTYILNLANPEWLRIYDSEFLGNKKASIRLTHNGAYSWGNVRIINNFIQCGYYSPGGIGVLIESTDTSNVGDIRIENNQFLGGSVAGDTYSDQAIKLNCSNGNINNVHISHNRAELVPLLKTVTTSSYKVKNLFVHDNNVWCNRDNEVLIYLDSYVDKADIHDNFLWADNPTAKHWYSSTATSDIKLAPMFHDNELKGAGAPDWGMMELVYRNRGLIIPVLTSGTDNWRQGNYITGSGTNSSIAASTDYEARTCDWLITSTGGTGVDITIKDHNGTIIANLGASCTNILLPVGCKINFGAFSAAPTVKFVPVQQSG